jgi:hypothetical protein
MAARPFAAVAPVEKHAVRAGGRGSVRAVVPVGKHAVRAGGRGSVRAAVAPGGKHAVRAGGRGSVRAVVPGEKHAVRASVCDGCMPSLFRRFQSHRKLQKLLHCRWRRIFVRTGHYINWAVDGGGFPHKVKGRGGQARPPGWDERDGDFRDGKDKRERRKPVETYAAVRQGGETLRRRRRPWRNIPPPRECARGNVRFAPSGEKNRLFFRAGA